METRYQRLAREQRERQEARSAQSKPKPKRKVPTRWEGELDRPYVDTYMRDPDGLDRDNLGESPDF